MTTLVWDKVDERAYEMGVDHGVLYDENHTNGVAWNGLVSVESSQNAGFEQLYYDGIKQLDHVSISDFELTITAFTMPIEFSPCLGYEPVTKGFYLTRQPRRSFGLVYRTQHSDGSYELHLVYNATVRPSDQTYSTITSNLSPPTSEWKATTRPEPSLNHRPTSHLVVHSSKVDPANLTELESILFGYYDTDLIDGGPAQLVVREYFSGGTPVDDPTAELIDGGGPESVYTYSVPTLISPDEVKAILEGP